eukprot:1418688-Alexandrium_andersonii.AAC.1
MLPQTADAQAEVPLAGRIEEHADVVAPAALFVAGAQAAASPGKRRAVASRVSAQAASSSRGVGGR